MHAKSEADGDRWEQPITNKIQRNAETTINKAKFAKYMIANRPSQGSIPLIN